MKVTREGIWEAAFGAAFASECRMHRDAGRKMSSKDMEQARIYAEEVARDAVFYYTKVDPSVEARQ